MVKHLNEEKMKKHLMNRLTIKLFCTVFLLSFAFSCTDDFMEINTNKATFMKLSPKEYGELFARALQMGVAWQSTDDMSRMSSTLALHNAGYTACGIQAYDQYQQSLGWQNSGFKDVYVDVIPSLTSIMNVAKEAGDNDVYNVAMIWKVYQLQRITDIWGPAAYTFAGTGAESIPYDSQKDIYYMMFDDLTSAVTALSESLATNPNLNVFGTNDRIYSGSVDKWVRLANTLRLRMAIRISNIDPAKAKLEGEAAVATGRLMETNDHDALYKTAGLDGEGNGMPRMESFFQDIMSINMESLLKGYSDPRMVEFWSPVVDDITLRNAPAEYRSNIGGYHGFASGSEPTEYLYFKAFSKYGPRFKDGNQLVTPINMMNAAEAWFLKAEGAWRGWNMGGAAQSFYEKGIEISIKQWKGASYSQSLISEYINNTATPAAPENTPYLDAPMTNIPVKFSSDQTVQYEQIMTQKWLALFPVGFEAWAEYRRTRLPKLYAKKYSVNANINPQAGQIQTRCVFVNDEYNANAAEVEKAKSLITGGVDIETAPLWWDVNPN